MIAIRNLYLLGSFLLVSASLWNRGVGSALVVAGLLCMLGVAALVVKEITKE